MEGVNGWSFCKVVVLKIPARFPLHTLAGCQGNSSQSGMSRKLNSCSPSCLSSPVLSLDCLC